MGSAQKVLSKEGVGSIDLGASACHRNRALAAVLLAVQPGERAVSKTPHHGLGALRCGRQRPNRWDERWLGYLLMRMMGPSGAGAPPFRSMLTANLLTDWIFCAGLKDACAMPLLSTETTPALIGAARFGSIIQS